MEVTSGNRAGPTTVYQVFHEGMALVGKGSTALLTALQMDRKVL